MQLDELGAAQQRMALAVHRVAELDEAFRRRFRRQRASAMELDTFAEDMQQAGEELASCAAHLREQLDTRKGRR